MYWLIKFVNFMHCFFFYFNWIWNIKTNATSAQTSFGPFAAAVFKLNLLNWLRYACAEKEATSCHNLLLLLSKVTFKLSDDYSNIYGIEFQSINCILAASSVKYCDIAHVAFPFVDGVAWWKRTWMANDVWSVFVLFERHTSSVVC